MLAVHVCDEVDVFGFGADALGRWDHYYREDSGEVVWFHPSDVEGRLRRELEEKGILKVFRGSRPDIGLPTLEDDAVTQINTPKKRKTLPSFRGPTRRRCLPLGETAAGRVLR